MLYFYLVNGNILFVRGEKKEESNEAQKKSMVEIKSRMLIIQQMERWRTKEVSIVQIKKNFQYKKILFFVRK